MNKPLALVLAASVMVLGCSKKAEEPQAQAEGQAPSGQTAAKEKTTPPAPPEQKTVTQAAKEVGEAAKEAGIAVAEKAKEAANATKGAAVGTAQKAKQAGEAVKEAAVGAAEKAKEAAKRQTPPPPPPPPTRPQPPQAPPAPPSAGKTQTQSGIVFAGPATGQLLHQFASAWQSKIAEADRTAFTKDFDLLTSLADNFGGEPGAWREALVGVVQGLIADGKLQPNEVDRLRALVTQLGATEGDALKQLLQENTAKYFRQRLTSLAEKWGIPYDKLEAALAMPSGPAQAVKTPPPPPPPPPAPQK